MSLEKIKKYKWLLCVPPIVIGCLLFLIKNESISANKLLLREVLLLWGYIAAICDVRTKTISNRLVGGVLCSWVLIYVPTLFLTADVAVAQLADSIIGFALAGIVLVVVYVVSHKGLGGGDVKFMAAAGLFLGVQGVMQVMLYGSVLAAICCGIMIALKKMTKRDSVPLAPFLYIGMLLCVFIG